MILRSLSLYDVRQAIERSNASDPTNNEAFPSIDALKRVVFVGWATEIDGPDVAVFAYAADSEDDIYGDDIGFIHLCLQDDVTVCGGSGWTKPGKPSGW